MATTAGHWDPPLSDSKADDGQWIPTVCNVCQYGQCATVVHVVNGVAVKVEGNPNAPHNMGGLCARGNAAIMDMYDPYRVKVPLKRTNPEKGLDIDPKFVEITWDEALDIIAQKLKAAREYDPRSFFINTGGAGAGDRSGDMAIWHTIFGAIFKWYGGQAACGNSQHAVGQWAHAGFVSGWDPEYTDMLVLVGANAGFGTWIGGAGGGGVRRAADARLERGMKVVSIDPRCSEGGNKANEWIPILPGTDLAFYLAVMHVLVHELRRYDVEFMKFHTNGPYLIRPDGRYVRESEDAADTPLGEGPHVGYYRRNQETAGKPLVWDGDRQRAVPFDDPEIREFTLEGLYEVNGEPCKPAFQLLNERLAGYTPEWASGITTVPASTIRRFAADWVKSARIGASIKVGGIEYPYRPVAAIGYHGSERHVNGPFTCMARSLMNALVGSYDVPGGNRGWEMRGTSVYDGAPPLDGVLELFPWVEVGGFPPDLDLHQLYPLAWDVSVTMNWTLPDAKVREKFKVPYTLKVMMLNGCNPFRSMGDPRQTEKAMKAIDFIFTDALWIDDPALFADVVLPGVSKPEQLGLQDYIRLMQVPIEAIMVRQPVVKPLYDTKLLGDILIELADRLGFLYGEGGYLDMLNQVGLDVNLGHRAQYPYRLDIDRKPTWEEIVETQAKAWFGEEKDLSWWKKQGVETGALTDVKKFYHWAPHFDRRYPIYFEPLLGFAEILKASAKENLGLDWDVSYYDPLPRWEPCPEHDDSKFPPDMDLYVINYKTPMNTNSASAHNVWLSEVYEADPYFLRLWMNEETGTRKGLKDGDKVAVESLAGKAEARLKLSQTIHPQVVAIAGAQGSWATSPTARKGINYASLIPLNWEEINPMLVNHDWCTRVRVTKR